MALPEATFYLPNKAAHFGHKVRARNLRASWDALHRFVNECTVATPPQLITLQVQRGLHGENGDSAFYSWLAESTRRFGSPARRFPGYVEWDATPDQVDALGNFLIDGGPWPVQSLGPIVVKYTIIFQWRDPVTGAAVPNQGKSAMLLDQSAADCTCPASMIHVIAAPRFFFVGTHLWFPYAVESPELAALLAQIGPVLPFKLSPRHFYTATPSRDGKRYRQRKVPLERWGALRL